MTPLRKHTEGVRETPREDPRDTDLRRKVSKVSLKKNKEESKQAKLEII